MHARVPPWRRPWVPCVTMEHPRLIRRIPNGSRGAGGRPRYPSTSAPTARHFSPTSPNPRWATTPARSPSSRDGNPARRRARSAACSEASTDATTSSRPGMPPSPGMPPGDESRHRPDAGPPSRSQSPFSGPTPIHLRWPGSPGSPARGSTSPRAWVPTWVVTTTGCQPASAFPDADVNRRHTRDTRRNWHSDPRATRPRKCGRPDSGLNRRETPAFAAKDRPHRDPYSSGGSHTSRRSVTPWIRCCAAATRRTGGSWEDASSS